MVGESIVYIEAQLSFSVAPATAGDCGMVTDMYGEVLTESVCATEGATVSISLPANGSATGPIYLLPAAETQHEISIKSDDGDLLPSVATTSAFSGGADAAGPPGYVGPRAAFALLDPSAPTLGLDARVRRAVKSPDNPLWGQDMKLRSTFLTMLPGAMFR